MPLEEAVNTSSGVYFQRYADYWWIIHREHGLVFYNPMKYGNSCRQFSYRGVPQCNSDERVTRGVSAKTVPFPVEVQQVPLVWVQANLSDYDH